MDHHTPSTSRTPGAGSEQDMFGTPTSGSARQLARKQGMARMSAVTLGVGAASILGAVAIAVTLPGSTAANPETSASAAAGDDAATITPDASADDTDDGILSQLQAALAPTTTDNPPAVTSGGS